MKKTGFDPLGQVTLSKNISSNPLESITNIDSMYIPTDPSSSHSSHSDKKGLITNMSNISKHSTGENDDVKNISIILH